jgi:hypothetical protein
MASGQHLRLTRELDEAGRFRVKSEPDLLPPLPSSQEGFEFDVCISFAGKNRAVAEEIASALVRSRTRFKLRVFYDEFEKLNLWGRDLFNELYSVYAEKCRYCVLLLSSDYYQRAWTVLELQAAQSRVLKERGDYLLPIVLDDSEPPEPLSRLAYLRWNTTSATEIAKTIEKRHQVATESDWLTLEEATEFLNEKFFLETVLRHIGSEVIGCKDHIHALRLCVLGFSMAAAHVKDSVRSYFEFLLFVHKELGAIFDSDDSFRFAFGGEIMRYRHRNGPILLNECSWAPVLQQTKGRQFSTQRSK